MNFRQFIKIIKQHGFEIQKPLTPGSHKKYKGAVNGKAMLVTVAAHRLSDDITRKTLASMIRQSGLDKKLFR